MWLWLDGTNQPRRTHEHIQMIEKKPWWRCGNACVITFPQHSMDTRHDGQRHNEEENDKQVDVKGKKHRKEHGRKALQHYEKTTSQNVNEWSTRADLGISWFTRYGGTGENDHLFRLFNVAGLCYLQGPEISTGRPMSTTDAVHIETYKGHWHTVAW